MDTSTANPNAANIASLAKTANGDKAATDANLQKGASSDTGGSFTNSNFKDLNSLSKPALYSGSGLNKVLEGERDIVRNDGSDTVSAAGGGDSAPEELDHNKGETTEKDVGSTTSGLNSRHESNQEAKVQEGSADKAGNGHPEFIKKLLLVPWVSKLVDLSGKLINEHVPDGILQKFKSVKDDQVPDGIDSGSAESTDIEVDSSTSDLNNVSEAENESINRPVELYRSEETSQLDDDSLGLEIIGDNDPADVSQEVESANNDQVPGASVLSSGEATDLEVDYPTPDRNDAGVSDNESNIGEGEPTLPEMILQSENSDGNNSGLEITDDAPVGFSPKVESNQSNNGTDLSNADNSTIDEGYSTPDPINASGSENEAGIREVLSGTPEMTSLSDDVNVGTLDPNNASGSENEAGIREVLSGTPEMTPLSDNANVGTVDLGVIDDDSADTSLEVDGALGNQVSDGIDLSNGESAEREVDSQTQDLNGTYDSGNDSNIQQSELNRPDMPLSSDNSPAESLVLEEIGNAVIGSASEEVENSDSKQISESLYQSNREGDEMAEESATSHLNHSNGQENESDIQESKSDQPGPMVQSDRPWLAERWYR